MMLKFISVWFVCIFPLVFDIKKAAILVGGVFAKKFVFVLSFAFQPQDHSQ
jgi:hypothetical protein